MCITHFKDSLTGAHGVRRGSSSSLVNALSPKLFSKTTGVFGHGPMTSEYPQRSGPGLSLSAHGEMSTHVADDIRRASHLFQRRAERRPRQLGRQGQEISPRLSLRITLAIGQQPRLRIVRRSSVGQKSMVPCHHARRRSCDWKKRSITRRWYSRLSATIGNGTLARARHGDRGAGSLDDLVPADGATRTSCSSNGHDVRFRSGFAGPPTKALKTTTFDVQVGSRCGTQNAYA